MSKLLPALAALLALGAGRAFAIELELQENREQRGNIGYVDMQKVYKAYPETIRAKENFEELVRQAEEQINLRKAEALRLRNELSQLKIERDFVARTPIVISTAPAETPKAPPAKTGAPIATLPGLDRPVSTASAGPFVEMKKSEPLVINIPGVSTAPIVVQPPAAVEAQKSSAAAAPAAVATGTAPAISPALAELDAKIALKAKALADKENDYKDYQAAQEKNLLDLESRRSEILLGKISKAIQDVAHQEGISVVVDKSTIVFGHGAVDLTDKVLKRLQNQ
ncbi:MAG: OmpH family outer membrane protein [Elusimicrobia bacterium]|nr:OmpH family outer membrane protein [Elusimicrobiota bacterium]